MKSAIRKIILDANLLIAVFDHGSSTSAEKKAEAKKILSTLMSDPTVMIVITPLIRYEVLRGINWHNQEQFNRVKLALDGFTEMNISREISELSSHLFRFDGTKNTTRNIDKRRFDVFHFATAQCEQLEFVSEDTGMSTLENLYSEMVEIMKYNQPPHISEI